MAHLHVDPLQTGDLSRVAISLAEDVLNLVTPEVERIHNDPRPFRKKALDGINVVHHKADHVRHVHG